MLISEFNFELPAELIAQEPLARREDSRLLVIDRTQQNWKDDTFKNFPEFIRAGDVVVLNNTRVFPARLIGRRADFTGKVELFLVQEVASNTWNALARPARRLNQGTKLVFGDEALKAQVLNKEPDGRVIVEFENKEDFAETLEKVGQTPLPPYIRRDQTPTEEDRERYQTVFAKTRGSVAASTAGLHFTSEILQEIEQRGAQIVEITLHVGYGTFEPVRVEHLSEHRVSAETSEISEAVAAIINNAKAAGNRVIAVGTTTTRTLENAVDERGTVQPGKRLAELTITPGYRFKIVDTLLTNFHLPQSSLLVLVSAFAGHNLTMAAYAHAVREKYRFYSYGDCTLIIART